MNKHPKTATSLPFIIEWFERARDNAKRQGKADSAQLWADGLAHIRHIAGQRDALVAALKGFMALDPTFSDCEDDTLAAVAAHPGRRGLLGRAVTAARAALKAAGAA